MNFRRLHECIYNYALDVCNRGYGHLWRSFPLVGSWLFRYKLKGMPAVSQCIPLHECIYNYALDVCNRGYGHLWRSFPLVGSWLFRYKLKGMPAVSQCIPLRLFDWCYYCFDVFDRRQAFDLKHVTQRFETWIAFKCDVSTQTVHVIDRIRINVLIVC